MASSPILELTGIAELQDAELPLSPRLSPIASNSTENCVVAYNGASSSSTAQQIPGSLEVPKGVQKDGLHVLLASLPDITSIFLDSRLPKSDPEVRRNSETSGNFFTNSYILSPTKWYKSSKKRRARQVEGVEYSIEYSVFRPILHLQKISNELDFQEHLVRILRQEGYDVGSGAEPDNFISTEDFEKLVSTLTHDVELDSELKPERISQGSSGSYFILGKQYDQSLDTESYKIFKRGIFKPKDEEPYGPLSPKWSKWIHRTFFPCFFGRSCLIPNLGYTSEAAACVLDRQLLSYIVPYTDVIYLKSAQFYYSFLESTKPKNLRHKIGSFQIFLNGYVEAQAFFKMFPIPQNIERLPKSKPIILAEDVEVEDAHFEFEWTRDVLRQFQEQLEKLVILDYIMRNTDRGADNWMIKLEWREKSRFGNFKKIYPHLKVGAIDSGLAFPWKHPDEWRSFPFGWLFLPYSIIGQPFSSKTRQHYLPLLTSKYWWEQTIVKLRKVFAKDPGFKERKWLKQVAVLKGQAFNVVEILKLNYAGPLELTRRENLLIWDDVMNVPDLASHHDISNAMGNSIYDLNSPSWGDDSESPPHVNTETTPLLNATTFDRRTSSAGSLHSAMSAYAPMQMSGFEYNVTYEDVDRHENHHQEETNTKRVIIERLEKVYSKSPVFTWC